MSMKALIVEEFGDSSKIKYTEVPKPEPSQGEVLVKNEICGLNFLEVMIRKGALPLKAVGSGFPLTMGVEAAGIVEKIGANVTGITKGERVAYAVIGSGAHAEYAKVSASRLVKVPDEISLEQAATSMIQGMTGHYLVHTTGRVNPGDKVLIHAISGGTGSLVCQVAKNAGDKSIQDCKPFAARDHVHRYRIAMPYWRASSPVISDSIEVTEVCSQTKNTADNWSKGAFVIGTTSTEAKAAKAREAGADEVILYSQRDFAEEVNRITDGEGVNVIYDGIGKKTFEKDFECLAMQGKVVSFGVVSGPPPPLDLSILAKGSFSVCRPSLFHHIKKEEDLKWRSSEVFEWIKTGKVKFGDFTVLPLSEGKKAYELLESGKSAGKILMKP